MRELVRSALFLIAVLLFVVAVVASPVCIIYALYSWGVTEVSLQFAAGAAVILWLKMVVCVVPGFAFLFFATVLEK